MDINYFELGEIHSKLNKEFFPNISGFYVYHYTSFDSALKITNNFKATSEKFTIWHTFYKDFEDKNEGITILKYFVKCLSNLCKSGIINKEEFQKYKKMSYDNKYVFYIDCDGYTKTYINDGLAFILSFTKKQNSSYMWNHYGGDGNISVSLGINITNLFEETRHYFGKPYIHKVVNVIYNKKEKKDYIENFLKRVFSYTHEESLVKYLINDFLNIARFMFKDSSFKKEEEIRSLIIVPKNFDFNIIKINNKSFLAHKFHFGCSIDRIYLRTNKYNPFNFRASNEISRY